MKKHIFLISVLSAMLLGSCVTPVTGSSIVAESSIEESSVAALSSIAAPDSLDKDNQPENDIHSELPTNTTGNTTARAATARR